MLMLLAGLPPYCAAVLLYFPGFNPFSGHIAK